MRSTSALLLGILVCIGCSNRTDSDEVRQIVEEQIENNEKLVEILKEIQDEKTMEAAVPKLKSLYARIEHVRKRALAVGRPSEAVLQELAPYVKRMENAKRQQVEEYKRISKLSEDGSIIRRIMSLSDAAGGNDQ